MASKIACGPSKLTLGAPADFEMTVICNISEERKSGPLKHCEGPRKYDIKGPNDPQEILLILTPGYIISSLV